MKNRKWLIGGATLTLGLATASFNVVHAQPDPNNTPKATNPENRKAGGKRKGKGKGNRRGDNSARQQKELDDDIKMLESLAGKPLTDEQKQQVKEALTQRQNTVQQAQDTYRDQLAKVAGVTSDELAFQMRQMRRMNGGGRRGQRGNQNPQNAPANPATAQPGNGQPAAAQPDAAPANPGG